MPAEPILDRAAFRKELTALVSDFASIQTAEFLITAIDVERAAGSGRSRTIVRFDLAGAAKTRLARRAARPLADALAAWRRRHVARRSSGRRSITSAAAPRRRCSPK